MGLGSGIATAVAWVAVVQVTDKVQTPRRCGCGLGQTQPLAWELPYAMSAALKEKKENVTSFGFPKDARRNAVFPINTPNKLACSKDERKLFCPLTCQNPTSVVHHSPPP